MAILTRFTELMGCTHPLQQAGMGGVATPDLAIAVSDAGALGMLSGLIGAEGLTQQLGLVPDGATIGVNFLVPFLDLDALTVAATQSRYVEFFWGDPWPAVVSTVHEGGALAGWQVGSAEEARAAADVGCDLVIAQGMEAGGHVRGTTGLLPLLDEVRDVVDVPVVAAGGIGTGRAMAAALVAGADAVRIGTRFVAAQESTAHPDYVAALIGATAEDTVLTTMFGVGWPDAPHRVLKSAVTAGTALGDAQSWTPDWPTVDYAGEVAARALYAGESVGAVRGTQPASEIVTEIVVAAQAILERSR